MEILKAVLRDAELVILDEPTSNLAPTEVSDLLSILRRLRAEGKGIIFISHKLPEVLEVCDRVVVLRNGRVSGRAPIGEVSKAELAEMMVGRDVTAPHERRALASGAVRLNVAGLIGPGVGPVSFAVRGGEILGVAGVDGNGQMELAESLAGLRRPSAGSLSLDGQDITERIGRGARRSRHGLYAGGPLLDRARARPYDRGQSDAARQSPSSLCARAFPGARQRAGTRAPVDA